MTSSFYKFCLCLLSFFLVLPTPTSDSVSFQISRFDSDTEVLLQGDAVISVGAIELINKVNYLCRVGRVIYPDKVRLWDLNSGKLADFSTHFSFSIDTQGRPTYGNGLAFFLAPVGFEIPPNSPGGFLGLFNTTTSDSSQNQIVSVEFDSFPNPEWDPPFEHVGINNNSIASAVTVPWNASMHSQEDAHVYITYSATSKNLSVSWSYGANSNDDSSTISYNIDLAKVLPEWVIIGFSAATGAYVARHTLNSWEFTSKLDIKSYTVRNLKRIGFIAGIVVSGCLLILLVITLFLWRRRQMIKERQNMLNLERTAGPIPHKKLVKATNNFSNKRQLGGGGFGNVYKGYLPDLGLEVAVKKISEGSQQGRTEYVAEVNIIGQLRHRHLVQLIGWCHEKDQLLLVYEFLPNRSLDSHLFSMYYSLTWEVRYKIALGLAAALQYLHEGWQRCVVHRDIKSSNVMLDSTFDVKLGDFGLARLVDHEQLLPTTSVIRGTFGYMAPDYMETGRSSKESDVYSFGVVLLEIIAGKRANILPMGLVEFVKDRYERGALQSIIDGRLRMDFDSEQAECLIIVGLWCTDRECTLRPSISQALQVLRFEAPLPDLPMRTPVSNHDGTTGTDSSTGRTLTRQNTSGTNSSIGPTVTCPSITGTDNSTGPMITCQSTIGMDDLD